MKNILVHLDLSKACKDRLSLARELSGECSGVAKGIHVQQAGFFTRALPSGVGVVSAALDHVLLQKNITEIQNSEMEAVAALVAAHYDGGGVTMEWKSREGDIAGVVAREAQLFDMLIMSRSQFSQDRIDDPVLDSIKAVKQTSSAVLSISPGFDYVSCKKSPAKLLWIDDQSSSQTLKKSIGLLKSCGAVDIYIDQRGLKKNEKIYDKFQSISHFLALHDIGSRFVECTSALAEEQLLADAALAPEALLVCGTRHKQGKASITDALSYKKLMINCANPIVTAS